MEYNEECNSTFLLIGPEKRDFFVPGRVSPLSVVFFHFHVEILPTWVHFHVLFPCLHSTHFLFLLLPKLVVRDLFPVVRDGY